MRKWLTAGLFLSIGCLATLTYSARTDSAFIPLPSPLPAVGPNASAAGAAPSYPVGAGTCVTETAYGTTVCRATDIDTLHAPKDANWSEFSTCCGGWADLNAWNATSTMFFVIDNGGGEVLMGFNPSTGTAAPLYTVPLTFNASWWDTSNPALAYGLGAPPAKDPVLGEVTYANPPSSTTQPAPTVIADLATAANCVPSLKGVTEWQEMAADASAQRFVVAAGTGVQDTAQWVIVWDVATGCRWFNTSTGQIGGNWGPAGAASWNPAGGYDVHSVRISGDGQTVLISPGQTTACGTGCYSGNFRAAWTVNSLAVGIGAQTGKNNIWVGHFAVGYSGMVNNVQYSGDLEWCNYAEGYHAFAALTGISYLIPTRAQCPTGAAVGGDQHQSWNDDDSSDRQPVFTSTVTNPTSAAATLPWQNEILAFSVAAPGTVWREGSTYSTGTSSFFSCQYAIGTVSQDGKFFMFTSDWGKTLGVDVNGAPRCDVFVARMH